MAEYQLFQTSSYLFETTKNVFFFKEKYDGQQERVTLV